MNYFEDQILLLSFSFLSQILCDLASFLNFWFIWFLPDMTVEWTESTLNTNVNFGCTLPVKGSSCRSSTEAWQEIRHHIHISQERLRPCIASSLRQKHCPNLFPPKSGRGCFCTGTNLRLPPGILVGVKDLVTSWPFWTCNKLYFLSSVWVFPFYV